MVPQRTSPKVSFLNIASLGLLLLASACGDSSLPGDDGGLPYNFPDGETGDEAADDEADGDAGSLAPNPGTEEPGWCGDLDVTTPAHNKATVVVLLDQSWSMSEDFDGPSRWDAVVETLTGADNGLIPMNEDRVEFGLAMYTSPLSQGPFDESQCPSLDQVGHAEFNGTAIADKLDNSQPVGNTPTGEALEKLADQMVADPSITGDKYIILATDGMPDTCAQPQPNEGQDVAVAAADYAHDLGIETRIISVGPDVTDAHLQDMANAGKGFTSQSIVQAEFYRALDSESLEGAFDTIIEEAVGCTFDINGSIDLAHACDGSVKLDGDELECGDDWKMIDESTLQLLGSSCETLSDGSEHHLAADWGCQVYVP